MPETNQLFPTWAELVDHLETANGHAQDLDALGIMMMEPHRRREEADHLHWELHNEPHDHGGSIDRVQALLAEWEHGPDQTHESREYTRRLREAITGVSSRNSLNDWDSERDQNNRLSKPLSINGGAGQQKGGNAWEAEEPDNGEPGTSTP